MMRAPGRPAVLVVLSWFAIAFLIWPTVNVLRQSVMAGGSLSLESLRTLVESDRVVTATINTTLMAIATVVTVNVVGIAQVVLLELVHTRLRRLLLVAFALPLVFGSVAAVTGYLAVYGRNGLVTKALLDVIPGLNPEWFTGWVAVLFVHTFSMTGYHFLFLRSAIGRVDYSMVEAARTLGQGPVRALLNQVLPAVRPTLVAVSLMVLIASLGSFAAPSLLTNGNFDMVGPLISTFIGLGRADLAALLALALGLVTIVLFVVMQRVQSAARHRSVSKAPTPIVRLRLRGPINAIAHTTAYLIALVVLAPVLITVGFSFASARSIRTDVVPRELSLANYRAAIDNADLLVALGNSVTLSAMSVGVALIVAVLVTHFAHYGSRWAALLDKVLLLPWILPSIVLAAGLAVTYAVASPLVFGTVLVGGTWLMPIAYVVVVLPVMLRMLASAYASLGAAQDEAARTLGARALRRFRTIAAPLIAPTVAQLVALTFVELLGEYPVSVMLYNINNTPLGVAIGTAVAANDDSQAGIPLALVTLLLALTLVVLLVADRIAARWSLPGRLAASRRRAERSRTERRRTERRRAERRTPREEPTPRASAVPVLDTKE